MASSARTRAHSSWFRSINDSMTTLTKLPGKHGLQVLHESTPVIEAFWDGVAEKIAHRINDDTEAKRYTTSTVPGTHLQLYTVVALLAADAGPRSKKDGVFTTVLSTDSDVKNLLMLLRADAQIIDTPGKIEGAVLKEIKRLHMPPQTVPHKGSVADWKAHHEDQRAIRYDIARQPARQNEDAHVKKLEDNMTQFYEVCELLWYTCHGFQENYHQPNIKILESLSQTDEKLQDIEDFLRLLRARQDIQKTLAVVTAKMKAFKEKEFNKIKMLHNQIPDRAEAIEKDARIIKTLLRDYLLTQVNHVFVKDVNCAATADKVVKNHIRPRLSFLPKVGPLKEFGSRPGASKHLVQPAANSASFSGIVENNCNLKPS